MSTCTRCGEWKRGGIYTNGDGYGDATYVDITPVVFGFYCWDCKDYTPDLTEEIDKAFVKYGMCGFLEAWIGRCRNEKSCDKHISQRCFYCKGQAVRNCSHAVSLVCGMPECDEHPHMAYAHGA